MTSGADLAKVHRLTLTLTLTPTPTPTPTLTLSLNLSLNPDLAKVQPAAIVPAMAGRHRAACYFLWPVMAQDGADELESGMVEQARAYHLTTLSLPYCP